MATVNEIVSEKIVDLIESGKILNWNMPFKRIKRNIFGKKNYSALNQLLLIGDTSEYFITPNKCIELSIDFSGTETNLVTYWLVKDKQDEKTKEVKKIFKLLYHRVIGLDSIVDDKKNALIKKHSEYVENIPMADIEKLIAKIGADIKTGESGSCYYVPSTHSISMPKMSTFKDAGSYYKTLFHELAHWTGHKSELNRHADKRYNEETIRENYSYEELVAELSSAMLSEYFGIQSDDSLENSASYIKSWAKHLKNDTDMIVKASGKAEKAVAHLLKKMGIEQDKEVTE